MSSIIDRLPTLVRERLEYYAVLEDNAATPEKDKTGVSSSALKSALRFFGIAEYILERRRDGFADYLARSASIRARLIERHDNGEPISDSFVAMIVYKDLFDALAAGAWAEADRLASLMGGRPEIEKQHDHPFDYAMGYTLKSFVLRDHAAMAGWSARFAEECEKRGNVNLRGYSVVFRAILDRDVLAANAGLRQIVEGHRKESKGRGVFVNTEDELLCVWGLGVANLCRHYHGLAVDAVPPLIPADLLCD